MAKPSTGTAHTAASRFTFAIVGAPCVMEYASLLLLLLLLLLLFLSLRCLLSVRCAQVVSRHTHL